MCLIRVSHEEEEAPEVGAATEGVGRESRAERMSSQEVIR